MGVVLGTLHDYFKIKVRKLFLRGVRFKFSRFIHTNNFSGNIWMRVLFQGILERNVWLI